MFHNESTLFETTFSCFFQVDASVGTEMGTMTEPDCLGPLEPGTSVTLEGIVGHETDGGKPVQYFFLIAQAPAVWVYLFLLRRAPTEYFLSLPN